MARPDFRATAARRLSEETELSPAIVSLLTSDAPTRTVGVRQIPIDHIESNPEQPRIAFNQDSLAELSASIREHGVLQPVLVRPLGREQILRDALEGNIDHYAYALIDCPPNLGLLTVNGLVAANSVIIPVQTQYYAMKGLNNLVKVINMIRLKLNKELRILGLLPTFYDGRTNLARDMLDELRVVGDHHVIQSIIRTTVKLGEAPLVGRPITAYAGASVAAQTYRALAKEVIDLG